MVQATQHIGQITAFRIRYLAGRSEAADKLLEYSLSKIEDGGLKDLYFGRWQASLLQISPQLLLQVA